MLHSMRLTGIRPHAERDANTCDRVQASEASRQATAAHRFSFRGNGGLALDHGIPAEHQEGLAVRVSAASVHWWQAPFGVARYDTRARSHHDQAARRGRHRVDQAEDSTTCRDPALAQGAAAGSSQAIKRCAWHQQNGRRSGRSLHRPRRSNTQGNYRSRFQ